jgi:hypothetical protein
VGTWVEVGLGGGLVGIVTLAVLPHAAQVIIIIALRIPIGLAILQGIRPLLTAIINMFIRRYLTR